MIKAVTPIEGYAHIKRIRTRSYEIRWGEVAVSESLYECYLASWSGATPTYKRLVPWLIRKRYTEDDELAIARRSIADTASYEEYNAYVEQCKKWAAEITGTTYTPDYTPTQAEVISQVRTLLRTTAEALPDEQAVAVPSLFEEWNDHLDATVGMRRYYFGKLYKCLQNHRTQPDWTPDVVPALWVEVFVDEWPEIPENIPSTAPWMAGDKGTWQGQHYICKIDNTVHNPSQYPAAWELIP